MRRMSRKMYISYHHLMEVCCQIKVKYFTEMLGINAV